MAQIQMSARRWRRSAVAAAAGLCLASVVFAQQTAGSISGTVRTGETVTIENPSIGFSRQVRADSTGAFQLSQLPAGTYKVTVTRADGSKESVDVAVQSGQGSVAQFAGAQRVVVTGSAIRGLDVKSTESSQILTKAEIDRIPVVRDVTAVTLLAPGATFGDSRLGQTATSGKAGNVPSLGGASPAENTYYINGFNVTNIVNGVAFNQLPFEAIGEQQVKTGGYGAEFGRSLGGVINITSKRGTNEWKRGVSAVWEPSDLRGSSVYASRDPVTAEWSLKERDGSVEKYGVNLWASGPLVKDQLFFFGLIQAETVKSKTFGSARYTELKNDSPQYLLKFDWQPHQNHLVELTAFSDKNTDKYHDWTPGTPYKTDFIRDIGASEQTQGGQNTVVKWTGFLTDDFTASALVGKGEYDRSSKIAGEDCPVVIDVRTSTRRDPGCWSTQILTTPKAGETRTAGRVDLEWRLGKHTLKGGLDHEVYDAVAGDAYSGGGDRYIMRTRQPGQRLSSGYVIPGTPGVDPAVQVVEYRHFENGGKFKTINSAWYLEDSIQITKDLVGSIGIRNESFTNKNDAGNVFIKVKNTWAPRLGAAWDVNGDASLKVFGNVGRYYIPVYANTNVRLSGRELDYTEWYAYAGSQSADRFELPALGAQLGGRVVSSDGTTPNPLSVVDPKIKPMFQDEFIVGAQKSLGNRWNVGLKYTHRVLKKGMDDICNDEGALNWALANGYTNDEADEIAAAIGHCFLYNPGGDLVANVDLTPNDADSKLTAVRIPASALQMPKPKRTYDALELTVEREWDKKWSLKGSYVLAFSKGNTEGYVKSDIGQDDAGISQDFDYPGLMEGAKGYLPNDRRHTIKLFGSYGVTDEWTLGANILAQSGRPKNCFGVYEGTTDGVSQFYGDASFWCGGKLNSRGAFGRLPWTYQLDLQANYQPNWLKGLSLTVDVLNVFDKRTVRGITETEGSGMNDPLSTYGQPIIGSLQPARKVRIAASYEF